MQRDFVAEVQHADRHLAICICLFWWMNVAGISHGPKAGQMVLSVHWVAGLPTSAPERNARQTSEAAGPLDEGNEDSLPSGECTCVHQAGSLIC